MTCTCERDQTDHEAQQCLHADPHRQSEGLHSTGGTVSSWLAAAHADGQSAGAGQGRGAAVGHHHGQQVLSAVLAGESTSAGHDASCVIYMEE